MPARSVPARHFRSYGTDQLPTPHEALQQPMRAFPSWFLRITCDRCGERNSNAKGTTAYRGCAAIKADPASAIDLSGFA